MRVIIRYSTGEYINIPGDRIEREENVLFAYDGDRLVGFFDMGAIDVCYISAQKKKEEGIKCRY